MFGVEKKTRNLFREYVQNIFGRKKIGQGKKQRHAGPTRERALCAGMGYS
jgi:hypothetical protein